VFYFRKLKDDEKELHKLRNLFEEKYLESSSTIFMFSLNESFWVNASHLRNVNIKGKVFFQDLRTVSFLWKLFSKIGRL